jgi:hypothetical protein
MQLRYARVQAMGFQAKHAAAAAAAAGVTDEKSALDWLMLHVAEAELPQRFAPGAAGDPIGIRKLAVAQSAAYRGSCALEEYGYPTREGDAALEAAGGNPAAALVMAFKQHVLMAGVPGDWEAWPRANATETDEQRELPSASEVWADERVVLQSMFGDDVTFPTDTSCAVQLASTEGSIVDAPVVLVRKIVALAAGPLRFAARRCSIRRAHTAH